MSKRYFCPICLTEQARSGRRKTSGRDCCTICEKFVKAINSPYLVWLSPSIIAFRKQLNQRHPMANAELVKTVVRDCKLSGDFFTEDEIVKALRTIREKLYSRLITEIRSYERYQFLTDILNMADQLYGFRLLQNKELAESRMLSIQDYAQKNIILNQYVGAVGKALERIAEVALSQEGFPKYARRSQQGLIWLLELGTEIVMVNQTIEDVVSLWHRGILSVDSQGWYWKLVPEDQNRYNELMQKWSLDDVSHERVVYGSDGGLHQEEYLDALTQLSRQTTATGHSRLGYDDEELIVKINNTHNNCFGHKYSEKLQVLLTLPRLPKILDRDWIFEDEIITFLGEELGFPKEVAISILDSLCLDGDLIRNEDAKPFEFRRVFRLIRRPLPKIRIGHRVAYYFSVWFLFRSFVHIQVEYYNGSHPELENTRVERVIKRLNQHYADYFVRERISPIFKRNGFTTAYHVKKIGQFDLRGECGEIDILSLSGDQKMLIVGECKHRVGKEIHVSQIRQEVQSFCRPKDDFVKKLRMKVKWVETHKHDVLAYLKQTMNPGEVKCFPVFITNYYCPASVFIDDILFLTEAELDGWCKKPCSYLPQRELA